MQVSRGYHRSLFARVASRAARLMGHPIVFAVACLIVVAWGLGGPVFGFSDTWQLVINTSTTIVTFLMVFLIQNTQTRDSMAVQVKLDELIRAVNGAHVALLDLEELTEEELVLIRERYVHLARRAREDLRRGIKDTGTFELPGERGRRMERGEGASAPGSERGRNKSSKDGADGDREEAGG